MRRTKLWLAAIAATSLIPMPSSASAAEFPESCDIGVPALVVLFPASSTHVSPGQTVDVGFGYINVESRPSSTFFFRKSGGGLFEVSFDPSNDFRLAVPSDWRFGRYRLVKIETRSLNATSEQLRNFALEGIDFEGVAHTGRCPLRLSVMDLVVSAGPANSRS